MNHQVSMHGDSLCRILSVAFTILVLTVECSAAEGESVTTILAKPPIQHSRFGSAVAIGDSRIAITSLGENLSSNRVHIYDIATAEFVAELGRRGEYRYDRFGEALDIDGNLLVVGAFEGKVDDDDCGVVYLFDLENGEQRMQLAPAKASDIRLFGQSVALNSSSVLIGAARLSAPNEEGYRHAVENVAFLFDAHSGKQLIELKLAGEQVGHEVKVSVGLSDKYAIVGAIYYGDDESQSGAAWVFDRETGRVIHKLRSPISAADGMFGQAVAINNNVAMVGAFGDVKAGNDEGVVYVYDVSTGKLMHILSAGKTGGGFGSAIALSNELAVVGGYYLGHATPLAAAHVFDVRSGNRVATFSEESQQEATYYASSVDLHQHLAVVGAFKDRSAGLETGTAFLYRIEDSGPIAPARQPAGKP